MGSSRFLTSCSALTRPHWYSVHGRSLSCRDQPPPLPHASWERQQKGCPGLCYPVSITQSNRTCTRQGLETFPQDIPPGHWRATVTTSSAVSGGSWVNQAPPAQSVQQVGKWVEGGGVPSLLLLHQVCVPQPHPLRSVTIA